MGRRLRFISEYHNTAQTLSATVQTFSGSKQSKQYLELEEKLNSLLELVDAVEVCGNYHVRRARKEVVNIVQNALKTLDNFSMQVSLNQIEQL